MTDKIILEFGRTYTKTYITSMNVPSGLTTEELEGWIKSNVKNVDDKFNTVAPLETYGGDTLYYKNLTKKTGSYLKIK